MISSTLHADRRMDPPRPFQSPLPCRSGRWSGLDCDRPKPYAGCWQSGGFSSTGQECSLHSIVHADAGGHLRPLCYFEFHTFIACKNVFAKRKRGLWDAFCGTQSVVEPHLQTACLTIPGLNLCKLVPTVITCLAWGPSTDLVKQ